MVNRKLGRFYTHLAFSEWDGYETGELISYLEQFDEETPVYLKHDRGYTYGAIKESRFEDEEVEADADEETDNPGSHW